MIALVLAFLFHSPRKRVPTPAVRRGKIHQSDEWAEVMGLSRAANRQREPFSDRSSWRPSVILVRAVDRSQERILCHERLSFFPLPPYSVSHLFSPWRTREA